MATVRYSINADDHISVDLDGEIQVGDTRRLNQVIETALLDRKEKEGPPWLTISLNSPGGDYIEGLNLGIFINRNGYQTLVRARSECYSAAAFAFLGGAFLGAVGGWGPDRRIEVGASIGFHGFYSESNKKISERLGLESGKVLSRFLLEYVAELRIDLGFVISSLMKRPDEFLMIASIEQCRKLNISPVGTRRTTRLTEVGAMNAANYATNWKRPISFLPKSPHSLAIVKRLTLTEYRRSISAMILERSTPTGSIESLLKCSAVDLDENSSIAAYCELEKLRLLPRLTHQEPTTVFHVSGFDFGGGFYVTDAFVVAHNEGTRDLSLTVVTITTVGDTDEHHFSHCGDCLFEVHEPDRNVVEI